jgi:hypothetical protein
METYSSPVPLSNIFGAAQIGDPAAEVLEFTPAKGIVPRGAVVVLAAGKAELVAPTGEANVYGITLEAVNTDATPPVSGAVARHGSYKASQLIVPTGVAAATIEGALRKQGILLEGDLVVPAA